MEFARIERCDDGRVHVKPRRAERSDEKFYGHPGSYPWRFAFCNTCKVVTIPVALTRLDPTRLPHRLRTVAQRVRWAIEDRRAGR